MRQSIARNFSRTSALAWFVLVLALAADARAVTISTVLVGDPGNASDPADGDAFTGGVQHFGAVNDSYRIGTTEVTVGQYADFLNAVAGTDTFSLYNTAMGSNLNIAGIARSGGSGSYAYSVIGSPNKPITYVSWGDAARFANWLNNGQPTGPQNASTTETGAYGLNGATSNAALNAVVRSAGATWFLPTENQWYKAAYYNPATSSYFQYPTGTNSVPISAPPGSTPNTANFGDPTTGYALTGSLINSSSQNYLTDVGAYNASASPYGTFDQGGNAWEWTESKFNSTTRNTRGGSWQFGPLGPLFSERGGTNPTIENDDQGFRVASIASIPEPSSFVLAASGLTGLSVWGWCRRRKLGRS